MPEVPNRCLARSTRTRGGAPFLTHYGPDGSRTELSVASFTNWVDKTANLLQEYGIESGDRVGLPVLADHPAHWMAMVWLFATWRAGGAAEISRTPGGAAAVVTGPHPDQVGPAPTFVCSLDPWGRAVQQLPDGACDFSSEALAQPDAFAGPWPDPAELALTEADRTLTHADLARLTPVTDRRCQRPSSSRAAIDLVVGAALGSGSVVLLDADVADAGRIASAERATMA
ncbi:MAG: TIGR03089 family protein [Propioniciclava sp.]